MANNPSMIIKTVAEVIQGLKSDSPEMRPRRAMELGMRRPATAEAVQALAEALEDEEWRVRLCSAWILDQIGSEAAEAVQALAKALKDQCEPVREASAYALGKIGPAAATAVPALLLSTVRQECRCSRYRKVRARSHRSKGITDRSSATCGVPGGRFYPRASFPVAASHQPLHP